ncbi:MAG: Methylated-DNA--protein-cysteine methyltransferase, constitutive [Deltaproteobacteria bacterium ADurb.Bin207]|nr:MAG: Methylated-DNA--protein-cysteine methyltransferase, constitutive [Deltaproteobacteria bacterium ADurb.Bin207]
MSAARPSVTLSLYFAEFVDFFAVSLRRPIPHPIAMVKCGVRRQDHTIGGNARLRVVGFHHPFLCLKTGDNAAMSSMCDFNAILPAPFGALGVRHAHGKLIGLVFLPPETLPSSPRDAFSERVSEQLEAYYANPEHEFGVPLEPKGTPFRMRVWRALQSISCGNTTTYGAIARDLGSAPRAVGQAVGDNPLPIVIPCHRVIASDGSLGGFSHSRIGYTLEIKRWLLRHEGVAVQG